MSGKAQCVRRQEGFQEIGFGNCVCVRFLCVFVCLCLCFVCFRIYFFMRAYHCLSMCVCLFAFVFFCLFVYVCAFVCMFVFRMCLCMGKRLHVSVVL